MPYPDNHFEKRIIQESHAGGRVHEATHRPDLNQGSVLFPMIRTFEVDLSKGNRVIDLMKLPVGAVLFHAGYVVENEADVSGNLVELINAYTSVQATGSITLSDNPADGGTVTLGEQTYKFVTELSGDANEVLIGAAAANTAANLNSAINGGGKLYNTTVGSLTPANAWASSSVSGGVVTVTAYAFGEDGNDVVLVESATNLTVSGSGKLLSGSDGSVVISPFAANSLGVTHSLGLLESATATVDIVTTNPYYLKVRVDGSTAPTEGKVIFWFNYFDPNSIAGRGLAV